MATLRWPGSGNALHKTRCRDRPAQSVPTDQQPAAGVAERAETPTKTRHLCPVIEWIIRPTVTDGGRKAPALRFGDLRVQALAGAAPALLFTVTGITNRSLRALGDRRAAPPIQHEPGQLRPAPAGPQRPDQMGSGAQPLRLIRDGLPFAHIYTKVCDRALRPLMALDRPHAPPELAAALDTLDPARYQPHRQSPRPHHLAPATRHAPSPTTRPGRQHASPAAIRRHQSATQDQHQSRGTEGALARCGSEPARRRSRNTGDADITSRSARGVV